MIACPACRRRVFTYREVLSANIEGYAHCPVCARAARLDALSRGLVSCTLALLLWFALYHGELFFSGYLFVFSTIFILAGWRMVAAALLPLLAIEKAPSGFQFNRRQSFALIAVLIVFAIAIDGLLSYRSEADKTDADTMSRKVSASSD